MATTKGKAITNASQLDFSPFRRKSRWNFRLACFSKLSAGQFGQKLSLNFHPERTGKTMWEESAFGLCSEMVLEDELVGTYD